MAVYFGTSQTAHRFRYEKASGCSGQSPAALAKISDLTMLTDIRPDRAWLRLPHFEFEVPKASR
jgi:hypothetical protein